MQLAIDVPLEPEAAAFAREVLASALADVPVAKERIEILRLLTTDIVTNAVRHAGLESGDSIGLGVEVSKDRVRVKVADDGAGFDSSDLFEPSLNERVDGAPSARDAVVGWLGRDQGRAEPRVGPGESVAAIGPLRYS